MKKGFTLIEMLGIITILGVILLVTFPVMNKSLKQMKENSNDNFTNNIKISAETYIELNRDKYPELKTTGGTTTITVQDLYDANLLKGKNENVDTSDQILVTVQSDMTLTYTFKGKQIGETKSYICDNETTFCISSRSDLENLATEVNNGDTKSGKTYILTQNIDLGGKFDSTGNPQSGNNPWTPIGSSTKAFSGTFDGAGHVITGMYIDVDATQVGLFSTINGGTIKNLGIENSYVKSTQQNTGSIAGYATNNSNILNCYNKATISAKKTSGGIVGALVNSTIKNCYNTGEINSNGQQFAAGIVGYVNNANSTIENCYNAGTITGTVQPGGIVGGLQGKVINSYNLGKITSTNQGGGIVGQAYNSPTIIGNYNISTTNGGIVGAISGTTTPIINNNFFLDTSATYGLNSTSSNEGANPLSSNDMPDVISIINGENAYTYDTKGINNGYPILKWQNN